METQNKIMFTYVMILVLLDPLLDRRQLCGLFLHSVVDAGVAVRVAVGRRGLCWLPGPTGGHLGGPLA